MKLIKNNTNFFKIKITFNNEYYDDSQFSIYYTFNNNKFFYVINSTCSVIKDFFNLIPIEGVKGFNQHIVSNKIFHLIYNEKNNTLNLFTWKYDLFIFGHKL